MLKPNFLLTHKVPVVIYRRDKGGYVDGDWVEGAISEITIQANIQPVKPHELLQFPESERSKEWYKIYSAELMRTQLEGDNGYDADELYWQGNRYKVMKVQNYAMGILDHHKAWAARINLTPN